MVWPTLALIALSASLAFAQKFEVSFAGPAHDGPITGRIFVQDEILPRLRAEGVIRPKTATA